MAAASRMLGTSNPLKLDLLSSSKKTTMVRYLSKAREIEDKKISGNCERKSSISAKASVSSESMISSKPVIKTGIDMASSLVVDFRHVLLKILRPWLIRRSWKLHAQMLIERVIIDFRFFTLFAVAGSLLGSILCFVEGTFLILQSYLQYFQTIAERSDDGHVIQLIFEAIDMFLVGTAMLIFGTGLYVLFIKTMSGKGKLLPHSNFFGLFHLKALPAWVGIQTVSHAKSKIGHAVLMILQVGVLEKFRNIPLVTGLDLACFAASILVSSACVFLLSKLSITKSKETN